MLWITLIRFWNVVDLSIYEHVTQFAANTRHKTFTVFILLKAIQTFQQRQRSQEQIYTTLTGPATAFWQLLCNNCHKNVFETYNLAMF